MQVSKRENRRISTLVILIIAGEAIFFLPFVMARIFRPTMLAFFDISNTELGTWFSIYGVVAMISYFFGGTLADRFSARNLMVTALWSTATGGFLMAVIPNPEMMRILYALWGFTTICLFWAAMIRATREWGGADFQGRAFGWLEGGRGAVAALLGTSTFLIFSWFSRAVPDQEVAMQDWHPFQFVILATSGLTLIAGFLVWSFIPVRKPDSQSKHPRAVLQEVVKLLGKPSIWMLSIIIICAYAGYKITDDFSLYAREVLNFSEVGAAGIGTISLWIRAGVAIIAGILADRMNKVYVISASFGLTIAGALLIGLGILDQVMGLVLLQLTLTATGIYGVRALYFAIMKEARISIGLTGTAVGIVSFSVFTPEIFMSPFMGHLLDKYPGALGHQYVFLLLSLFAFIGLIISLVFGVNVRNRKFNGS